MAITRYRSVRTSVAVLAAVLALASVGLSARRQPPLAIVTHDLTVQLALAPHVPIRVIAKGEVAELRRVADRLALPVLRVLDQFIVVSANAVQVAALQLEPSVQVL